MAQVGWIRRWLAVFLGGLGGALLLEIVLRFWAPIPLRFDPFRAEQRGAEAAAVRVTGYARMPGQEAYQADELLGFRPVPGGRDYGAHGALRNRHALARTPGVRRLLFLGDSATRRGAFVDGFEAELGSSCESWNAGVEGYSTLQELEYYRRHLAGIEADHVVLLFHLNDYDTTPVILRDGERVITIHERKQVVRPIGWLWDVSFLYRLERMLAFRNSQGEKVVDPELSRAEVHGALLELAELARARGADFTVAILPWLQPHARWPAGFHEKHASTVAVLERAGIRHFTFLDELAQAYAEAETVQERKGDAYHPSPEFGRRIVRAMLARGFVP